MWAAAGSINFVEDSIFPWGIVFHEGKFFTVEQTCGHRSGEDFMGEETPVTHFVVAATRTIDRNLDIYIPHVYSTSV